MFRKITIYVSILGFLLGGTAVEAQTLLESAHAMTQVADTLSPGEAPVWEEVTDDRRETETLNFDPFDYRLQSRFLEKGEPYRVDSIGRWPHLTLGFFGGYNFHANQSTINQGRVGAVDRGYSFGAGLRYQWTPLHGVRAAYVGSRYNDNPFSSSTLKVNELMLGYTFNFTNYFKGYNPKARFQTLASLSVAGARVASSTKKESAARAELGLMFDYRFWRNWSVFVEPYIGVATDNYDQNITNHGFDYIGGVRAGVQLNATAFREMYNHAKRAENNLYQPKAWYQNFFTGASAGRMFSNASRLYGLSGKWVDSHVFLGYRFSPVQSLRVMATYFKSPEPVERKHHVMGEIDYLLNFNSFWNGYDPNRHWRVSGLFGVGMRYLDTNNGQGAKHMRQYDDKLAPYATLGLDINYYLTKQISFFAEPYAALAFPVVDGQKKTLFGGLRGGFQLDFIDTYTYMPRRAVTSEEKKVALDWGQRPMSHFFYGMSAGIMGVHKHVKDNYTTMPFNVFLGYRFTPVQALRLQATYIKSENERLLEPHTKHVMGQLDYMVNFTNLFYGYNPSRIFDVNGYIGVGAKYLEPDNTYAYGKYYLDKKPYQVRLAPMFTSGANVSVRLYKGINAFVEPWAGLHYARGQRFYVFTYGLNGGLSVNFDNANLYGERVFGRPASGWNPNFLRHFFVGGGGGLLGIHTVDKAGKPDERDLNHFNQSTDMFFGYRFTPNQALRARAKYNRTQENRDRSRHLEGTIDYMVDMTNAFAGYDPQRPFSVYTYAGIGARYLTKDNKDWGARDGYFAGMATMGAGATYRIKNGLSAYAEPYLSVSKYKSDGFYTMMYGLNAGLMLDFAPIYAYRPRFGTPSEKWMPHRGDRIFFGGNFGWLRIQRQKDDDLFPASLFVGYRFSPIHALRAKLNYNHSPKGATMRRYHMSGNIDYMFNLTNMLNEYDPSRRFHFTGVLGLGIRYPESRYTPNIGHLRLQGNAGLNVSYAITPNVHAFVEPYVGAVRAGERKEDFLDYYAGLNTGFFFTVNSFRKFYKTPKSQEDKIRERLSSGPFFEGALGFMQPVGEGGGTHMAGQALEGRIGYWTDPMLGVRASFLVQNYYYGKHYVTYRDADQGKQFSYAGAMSAKLRIEGLLNPLNISQAGQHRAVDRKFDINLSAGIEMGGMGKKYSVGMGQENFGIYGITAAAQFLYHAGAGVSLFAEPRFEHVASWYLVASKALAPLRENLKDNIFTLNAGVRVTRPTLRDRKHYKPLAFREDAFIALSVGGYRAVTGYKPVGEGYLGLSTTANLGYHFTPIHSAKAQMELSFYSGSGSEQKYRFMDYRLLYMANLTNLYLGKGAHCINVYGELGGVVSTVAKSPKNVKLSKVAPGLAGGFLVTYNLNRNFSITCEPLGQFVFKKDYLPGWGRPHMKQLRMDLSAGVMYNF